MLVYITEFVLCRVYDYVLGTRDYPSDRYLYVGSVENRHKITKLTLCFGEILMLSVGVRTPQKYRNVAKRSGTRREKPLHRS